MLRWRQFQTHSRQCDYRIQYFACSICCGDLSDIWKSSSCLPVMSMHFFDRRSATTLGRARCNFGLPGRGPYNPGSSYISLISYDFGRARKIDAEVELLCNQSFTYNAGLCYFVEIDEFNRQRHNFHLTTISNRHVQETGTEHTVQHQASSNV